MIYFQFKMNRYISATIVITATVLLLVVSAEAELGAEQSELVDQVNAENGQSTEVEEGRIRKHALLYGGLRKFLILYKNQFNNLKYIISVGGGLGGLHSLALLYAIKVKIIVVAVIVGLAVYYYGKFGKGYGFGYDPVLPYEA